jgi:hypothetical protein
MTDALPNGSGAFTLAQTSVAILAIGSLMVLYVLNHALLGPWFFFPPLGATEHKVTVN